MLDGVLMDCMTWFGKLWCMVYAFICACNAFVLGWWWFGLCLLSLGVCGLVNV